MPGNESRLTLPTANPAYCLCSVDSVLTDATPSITAVCAVPPAREALHIQSEKSSPVGKKDISDHNPMDSMSFMIPSSLSWSPCGTRFPTARERFVVMGVAA